MGPWHANTQRLDLRPRKCPPVKQPHIQDPGNAVNTSLFLGLFDVTLNSCVAVGHCLALFVTVWHCFDHCPWFY